jgi:hypothetical protein
MTQDIKDVLKLALEFIENSECGTADLEALIKEALREHAMREVQRLGQEIEQEPFAWFRYQQGSRVYYDTKKWDDCQPLYTAPPQRTWVGLTESDRRLINFEWQDGNGTATEIIDLVEAKLKEKNT